MRTCPKCNRQIAALEAAECPFCGIVFDSHRRRLARARRQPLPIRAADRQPAVRRPAPAAADTRLAYLVRAHRRDVADWAQGKIIPFYALVLCCLFYLAVRYSFNAGYSSLFDGLNLAIHEGGHLLFRFFGTYLMIAGGTLLQLAVPLACCCYFYRRPDYFGIAFCGVWLAANCYNVAVYVADARTRLLPLVTVGGGVPIHDWHYLLSRIGLLRADHSLAFALRAMGFVLIWGSLGYAVWLMVQMVRTQGRPEWINFSCILGGSFPSDVIIKGGGRP